MTTRLPHHAVNGFQNPWPGFEERGFFDILRWMILDHRKPIHRNGRFDGEIGRVENDGSFLRENESEFTVTWVGHSTALVQLQGVNILTDPVWSDRISPLFFAGPRRHGALGLAFGDLPRIDVVLITHDHYDHMDRATIRRLGNDPVYFVPMGVGAILRKWGIHNYVELDWRQSFRFRDLEFICTPAQHFSGRDLFRRNRTLWCGWLVRGDSGSFFTAGDTGYFPGFREISDAYGPVDLVCLPIGAYLPRWFMRPVHLSPDEAIRAFCDLRAGVFVPVHFGTYRLAEDPLWLPPKDFQASITSSGIDPERFWLLRKGETRRVPLLRDFPPVPGKECADSPRDEE